MLVHYLPYDVGIHEICKLTGNMLMYGHIAVFSCQMTTSLFDNKCHTHATVFWLMAEISSKKIFIMH